MVESYKSSIEIGNSDSGEKTMANVTLVPHSLKFADRMFELSSAPQIKDVLGIRVDSVEDTKNFILSVIEEEKEGKTVSRVILNERDELIGVTTLMFINRDKKRCHMGTWIGHEYWGLGYNLASKIEILKIAFQQLGMEHVFAGAKKVNMRSRKAQEKLPFIRLNVEELFPEEHAFLENRTKQPCVLHAFFREDFERYINEIERQLVE
jgi:RimJ/RimL family protein N-acetyltransferase